MDKVAHLSTAQRLEIFEQVANRKNLSLIIVEKDFWVCWTLEVLFSLPEFKDKLIFKGGTSLSKVFGVIERFSEDIDISITREALGFVGDKDPENQPSKTKEAQSVLALREASQKFVKRDLYPAFDKGVMGRTSVEWPPIWGHGVIGQDEEGNLEEGVINFSYPRVNDAVGEYIPRRVRVEFGASSDPYPVGKYQVRSYVEEEFPHLFEYDKPFITVLEPERTFWEKVTILHAQYHRPLELETQPRISRHYYDVYRLSKTQYGERALKDLALLARVAEHKSVYFKSAAARYDLAKPGTVSLTPHVDRNKDLKDDYDKMQQMIHGTIPTWEEVIETLRAVEQQINAK